MTETLNDKFMGDIIDTLGSIPWLPESRSAEGIVKRMRELTHHVNEYLDNSVVDELNYALVDMLSSVRLLSVDLNADRKVLTDIIRGNYGSFSAYSVMFGRLASRLLETVETGDGIRDSYVETQLRAVVEMGRTAASLSLF
jgi:hypothetical protein